MQKEVQVQTLALQGPHALLGVATHNPNQNARTELHDNHPLQRRSSPEKKPFPKLSESEVSLSDLIGTFYRQGSAFHVHFLHRVNRPLSVLMTVSRVLDKQEQNTQRTSVHNQRHAPPLCRTQDMPQSHDESLTAAVRKLGACLGRMTRTFQASVCLFITDVPIARAWQEKEACWIPT